MDEHEYSDPQSDGYSKNWNWKKHKKVRIKIRVKNSFKVRIRFKILVTGWVKVDLK